MRYVLLELWANFGPNILFWAFRIGGAEKLHNKVIYRIEEAHAHFVRYWPPKQI